MTRFQRIAITAFVALEILIFVGAAVRATGSGLGCPDWPFCYGCWVPPTSADQIVFTEATLEKFRAKAAKHGRDASSITLETLKAEFDPVATWVEYLNRLTSLPVALSVFFLVAASIGEWRARRPQVFLAAVAALVLLLVNAWLGARVVYSGLRPGTITLHMALAILMQVILVYAAWRGTSTPWRFGTTKVGLQSARRVAFVLFTLVVIEGVMGSQVREMTDQLALQHSGQMRSLWASELEQTWVYIVHRSFSWFIVACAAWFVIMARRCMGRMGWLETAIASLVAAQMVLGLILAQVAIYPLAQILHIGLSSLLVSGLVLWILGCQPPKQDAGFAHTVR
ncbi:MAG: COX15/CtaA family protein [Verrucomicrobiaceae bacterium]